ncbi:methyltransferase [Vallitalea sp.]|jgi:hypothetical protein|uniref:methyltransferase n=1 Tax=Vallitalea sp. TaxID=1882829 RepID=UPI0025F3229C|nr:methyltransferase [Vallitalea sp.]MCT4687858.1 methyltransferase [Vallitalea sp.]
MELEENIIISKIQGYYTAYLMYVACELNIFDYLYNENISINDLSKKINIPRDKTYRLIRPLVANSFINEKDELLSLTKLGQRLSEYDQKSLKGFVLFNGRECMTCWSYMYEALIKNIYPFKLLSENDFFDAQVLDDNKFDNFNLMMRSSSKNMNLNPYLEQQHNKDDKLKIVDLGGGAGDIISKFLMYYHNSSGTIIDLEHVRKEAEHNIRQYELADRCIFVSGDFFTGLNIEGDIFILSRIIHDWEDEDAINILKNVKNNMDEHSRLLIIEKIIPEKIEKKNLYLYMNDLHIWSMCGGKERTKKEFIDICLESGLILNEIYKLANFEYILEFQKDYYEEGVL